MTAGGPFHDLKSYAAALEKAGELARVRCEVDPELEITQITQETIARGGPALIFERVKDSGFPLAINLLGSERRIELALGRHPGQIGEELARAAQRLSRFSLVSWLKEWRSLLGLRFFAPRRIRSRPWASGVPDLRALPALKCWPKDAGRFLTFPIVISSGVREGLQNAGVYRMQITGPAEAIVHWQIQKGGAAHAAERGRGRMPVAVALGADPALLLAAVFPLPEGADELGFAGILRGARTKVAGLPGFPLRVPQSAEFLLEGWVDPAETALEGPFGDHFGHYSHPARFPVFHAERLWRKPDPIYVASVAGKPPQEDRAMGEAANAFFGPILRLLHPEIAGTWAYHQAGFHNLAVAAIRERYGKEGIKAALGLLGQGQMSLTKVMILVDENVDVRSFRRVLEAVRRNFDPAEDFLILPRTAQDTLDFTGPETNFGSKMVMDCCSGGAPPVSRPAAEAGRALAFARKLPQVAEARDLDGTLLAVSCRPGSGRGVLERLLKDPSCAGYRIIAAVSEDVALADDDALLWGIFTRFDCARDVAFGQASVRGAQPCFSGPLGVDATFKSGYPDAVEMSPEAIETVKRRWPEYGILS